MRGGARKMRDATASHVGRPIAILIDGNVVMAPTLRDPISADALITGDYSRAEAERIVNGISIR
jgi:preprotein translocase subunit SecD